MNLICVTGRITKDLELQTLQNGTYNCNFSIAVERGYKDEQGNMQVDFFSVVAWNSPAEFLCKYCKKGDKIGIKGRLQTRQYQTQNGETRFITEIVVDQVESYQPKETAQAKPKQEPKPKNIGVTVNGKAYNPVDDDQDLPF